MKLWDEHLEQSPKKILLLAQALLSLASVLLTASVAQAVLINSGDGTGNTSAPQNDPGFGHVAIVNGLSAVYLQNGWLLTAYHVGSEPIELGGVTYELVPNSRTRILSTSSNPPDLALIKIVGDPGLSPLDLADSTPPLNSEVTLIGRGRSRGSATSYSGLDGWSWAFPFTIRWGTNRISDASTFVLDTQAFSMEFDPPTSSDYTTHEASATIGDSGGAVFFEKPTGWTLAGIMFSINQTAGQPPQTTVYSNRTFAVDLATYRSEILSIISTPDCANGLDDDLDGQIDMGSDPGCASANDTSEQSLLLECDNGLDDDLDNLIDFPNDPDCTSSTSISESVIVPALQGVTQWITIAAITFAGLRKIA